MFRNRRPAWATILAGVLIALKIGGLLSFVPSEVFLGAVIVLVWIVRLSSEKDRDGLALEAARKRRYGIGETEGDAVPPAAGATAEESTGRQDEL
jgi:hypothetical protein